MTLEHELGVSSIGIPELNASVFRSTKHPSAVRCKGNAEHKILRKQVSRSE